MKNTKTNPHIIHQMPTKSFEKAEQNLLESASSIVLEQYKKKRTKREKIKFLKFMGYYNDDKSSR
jgi:hypothetical protein